MPRIIRYRGFKKQKLKSTGNKEILGVTLFGEAAGEIINLITMAMDNKIPYNIARTVTTTNHGQKI